MGSSLALTGALCCLLTVGHFVVRPVSSELCEINVSSPFRRQWGFNSDYTVDLFLGSYIHTERYYCTGNTVHSREGTFGSTLVLNAEVQGDTYLRQWSRVITDKNGGEKDLLLATYDGSKVVWKDEADKELYTAFYIQDSGATKSTFKFEFKNLNCQQRGVFFCNFFTAGGKCSARYSVNITADPLPPFIKNHTIIAEDGDEVAVFCEGNVGYPAGDLAWYYVPADGGAQKLPVQPNILESAGDCRSYAKSTLVYTVKKEDHMSKFRCVARNYLQKNKESVEVDIQIKGIVVPKTTPKSTGGVVGVDGASARASLSVLTVLLSTFLLAFASSILHT